MKIDDLRSKAFDTAKLWAACDEALAQVDEAFGTPWQASRDTLNTSLLIADRKGVELEQFQGPKSLFKFPEIGTQVIVKVSRLPVPCDRLEKLDIRIEKAERELKLLKNKRKKLIEEFKIKGLEFVTEKIATAYTRIAK
tara:strand:+ start:49 stop:465 length:417 start_codon:yes stop_codon:yes gene_type:complete